MKELKSRGRKIIKGFDREKVSIAESAITTGGGSSPDEVFPSLSIRLNTEESPDTILKTLREASPPIIGTISEGEVHLNLATIQEDEIPHVRRQLEEILGA
jgi:L-seryl-tRNA(Ser) seleniumtransferase